MGGFIMDKFILSPIDLEELLKSFREIVREEVAQKKINDLQEKFLSPAEVCELFQPKISKPTLISWTRSGRLTEHRIGSRIFYKYSEIVEAITKLKKYKRA